MKQRIILIAFLLLAAKALPQQNGGSFTFPLPKPPTVIQTPSEKAAYVVLHYWDQFPFTNAKVTAKPESFEQQFADYLYLLSQAPTDKVAESINITLRNASKGKIGTLKTFVKLYEKYLFDPNSPMQNEEQYIPVLQFIVHSPLYSDADKIRHRHQLKLALHNRVGEVATDFSVTLGSGTKVKLTQVRSQYTLLYFNNPDCHDCKRVKEYLERSDLFARLIDQKRLMIFAIFPDEDLSIWRKTIYPKPWLNGYDDRQTIQTQSLYDLKAMPTLYLLDVNKRVLLKDQSVETIEKYLKQK